MAYLEIRAKIDKKLVKSAVKTALRLIKAPKNLKIFVIDNANQCRFVAEDLKGFAKKAYEKFCKTEKTSMSISVEGHEHLIVFITPEDLYLKKNKLALIGTIIHELMHTYQRRNQIDEQIFDDLKYITKKWLPKFRKLGLNQKKLARAMREILDEAAYALKDIYANYELTKKGLGKYILEDYKNLYKGFKLCPTPLEFEKLHKAAKKNLHIMSDVIQFQLSILAVVIPLLMWKRVEAQRLAKNIEKCYRVSVTKVTYEFDDLISFVVDNYGWKDSFRRKYFDIIMQKVYTLVT